MRAPAPEFRDELVFMEPAVEPEPERERVGVGSLADDHPRGGPAQTGRAESKGRIDSRKLSRLCKNPRPSRHI
jgi:hypothetical protein